MQYWSEWSVLRVVFFSFRDLHLPLFLPLSLPLFHRDMICMICTVKWSVRWSDLVYPPRSLSFPVRDLHLPLFLSLSLPLLHSEMICAVIWSGLSAVFTLLIRPCSPSPAFAAVVSTALRARQYCDDCVYLAKTYKTRPEDGPVVKVRPSDDRFIFSGKCCLNICIWFYFCIFTFALLLRLPTFHTSGQRLAPPPPHYGSCLEFSTLLTRWLASKCAHTLLQGLSAAIFCEIGLIVARLKHC